MNQRVVAADYLAQLFFINCIIREEISLMLKTSSLAFAGAAMGCFLSASAFALPAAPLDLTGASSLVLVADGDHREVAEAEHRVMRQICVDCGAYELGEALAARWWDRRYVFYYPPFAPELPSIFCPVVRLSILPW